MAEWKADDPRLQGAMTEVQGWLNLKMRTGRFSVGFALEMALHLVTRSYNVHAIYDEVGKLEGSDPQPSATKPATPFLRPPLAGLGLWHKHHSQAQFFVQNLMNEIRRPGMIEAVLAPYAGQNMADVAAEISRKLVVDASDERKRQGRETGEFIVYEVCPDRSHYYLTLGSHGEWAAIRSRVDAYKLIDARASETPP